MHGPVAVQINDGATHWHDPDRTNDLRFSRDAYGGDVDLTCVVEVLRSTFKDLGPGDTIKVVDAASGKRMWKGTIDNPGESGGATGERFTLQAMGGASQLQAISKPLAPVYCVDDGFRPSANRTRGSRVELTETTNGSPRFEVSWDKDYKLESGDLGELVLREFQNARLKLGKVRADVDAGLTSSGYVQRLMTGTTVAALSAAASRDANSTSGTLSATIGSGIASGDDIVALRAIRTGADLTIPDKSHWFRFADVIVLQLLKDKFGDDITTGYGANTVFASEVIADMIGRNMCPGLDPAKTTITTTSYPIDALAFLDGITMGDALDELNVFEPDLFWTVYDDEGTFGLWDDTEPCYIIDEKHGAITLPGEDITLCDRILVKWTDRRGREQTTEVTITVDELEHHRDAESITLPEGSGSEANAQRAGEAALALNNRPPKAGTAVIRGRIRDEWGGCEVLPHEVMPARPALDQATGHMYRVTRTDYSEADDATVLTLGTPRKSLVQRMARLNRKQRRRRR